MTKCMSYREGEIESKTRHLVSEIKEHLRSSNPDATQIPFFIFSTRIYTIYAFIGA